MVGKMSFLFGNDYFQGRAVSFREGILFNHHQYHFSNELLNIFQIILLMNQINNGNQTNDFLSAMFNEPNKDMIQLAFPWFEPNVWLKNVIQKNNRPFRFCSSFPLNASFCHPFKRTPSYPPQNYPCQQQGFLFWRLLTTKFPSKMASFEPPRKT